jgi:hypothetical protein
VVGDHKPVDPVGHALGEDEPDDPTDVVDDKRKAVEVRLVDEALQVVGVARKRVLELLRLGTAPEARQVGGDASRALKKRSPDPRSHRVPVQVEDRGGRMPRARRLEAVGSETCDVPLPFDDRHRLPHPRDDGNSDRTIAPSAVPAASSPAR